MPVDAADGLAAVRAEVESACQSLVLASPEAVGACEDALRRAAEALRRGRVTWVWQPVGEAARGEATRLQTVLRRAGRLLASASQYHAGWLRILSAMTGGYSPEGEAAPLRGIGRLSVEG
jgi:hypothetical protein